METLQQQELERVQSSDICALAIATLDSAYNVSQNSRDIKHPLRVSALLTTFCPSEVNEGMTAAALLHDQYDRAVNSTSGANTSQVAMYNLIDTLTAPNTTVGGDLTEYVFALLDDTLVTENVAKNYRNKYQDEDELMVRAVRYGENVQLTPDHWAKDFHMLCSPSEMLDLLKNTNIEAVMLKSAEILDNLLQPPKSDVALLRDVYEALYFYAPMLQILGRNEMSAALTDQALRIKVAKSGQQWAVDRAHELSEAADDKVASVVQALFPGAKMKFGAGTEKVYQKMGVLILPNGNDDIIVEIRVKADGSLANKLVVYDDKYPEYGPNTADVIGANIIVEDWQTAIKQLDTLLQTVSKNEAVKHSSAPSKVGGVSVYCVGIDDGLLESVIMTAANFKQEVGCAPSKSECYKAIKLYLECEDQRVEVQIVTREAHDQNRYGEGSHMFHKANEKDAARRKEQACHIKAIHDRMGHLVLLDYGWSVNGQSLPGSYKTFSDIVERAIAG